MEMTEFWAIALPVLLVDIANPVLLAAVILAVTTPRPYANAAAIIAGHTLAYFAVGLLIVYGFGEVIAERIGPVVEKVMEPTTANFAYGFIIGVLLIWVAALWRTNPPKPSDNPPEPANPSVLAAFGFGGLINFVGMPFALPYFAVMNLVMKMDPTPGLIALGLYNAGYAIPFLLIPAAFAMFGQSIMPMLQRFNTAIEKYAGHILPLIFGLMGAVMVFDAIKYAVTGSGLY